MLVLSMMIQATEVRVEGAIPLWALIIGIVAAAFTLGGIAIRTLIHSRYHSEHFKHQNDREIHARISESEVAQLRQAMAYMTQTVTAHLESDIRVGERNTQTLDNFRQENKENLDSFRKTLDEFRQQAQANSQLIIKALTAINERR